MFRLRSRLIHLGQLPGNTPETSAEQQIEKCEVVAIFVLFDKIETNHTTAVSQPSG